MKAKNILFSLITCVTCIATFTFAMAQESAESTPSDSSVLTQSSCEAPCWYGLTPGQTTLEDARAAIPNIAFISSADTVVEGQTDKGYSIGWQYAEAANGPAGNLLFKDDVLHSIHVSPSPNLQFSLADILDRYGEPAGFTITYSISEILVASLEMSLYYPKLGIIVNFSLYNANPPQTSYPILPEALGESFELYAGAESLEALVADQYGSDIENAQAQIQTRFFLGWPGLYSTIENPKEFTIGTALSTPVISTAIPATLTQTAMSVTSPAATNGAFPTTNVLDNFNRADGIIGTNWVEETSGYNIAGDQLDVTSGGSIYWNAKPFGEDQEAFITLVNIDPSSEEIDLMLKWGAVDQDYRVLEVWYQPSSSRVQVWTHAPREDWVQRGDNIPATFAPGDQFGARAQANGMVDVYQNGTLLATRDVSAWRYAAEGGSIGLWMINAGNMVLDDFGGGTAP